jgi:hypothetical protein
MNIRIDRIPPALKHGAYAATAVLPGESQAAFEKQKHSAWSQGGAGRFSQFRQEVRVTLSQICTRNSFSCCVSLGESKILISSRVAKSLGGFFISQFNTAKASLPPCRLFFMSDIRYPMRPSVPWPSLPSCSAAAIKFGSSMREFLLGTPFLRPPSFLWPFWNGFRFCKLAIGGIRGELISHYFHTTLILILKSKFWQNEPKGLCR